MATKTSFRVWNHAPKRRRARKGEGCLERLQSNQASAEKITIGVLLVIAWGWIMVTIGMVFYHGYFHRGSRPGYNPSHKHYLPGFEPPKAPEFQPGRSASSSDSSTSGANDHGLLPAAEQAQVILEKKSKGGNEPSAMRGLSPLLVFTYHRAEYLRETLNDVYKYIPRDCSVGCPVVVSQDGKYEQVAAVIQEFQQKFKGVGIPLVHWQHEQSQQSGLRGRDASINNAKQYAALANHYKWALTRTFDEPPYREEEDGPSSFFTPQRVIILEEDLHIAPDFFTYFAALAPLLDRDATLLAVSAYNDNGLESHVQDTTRIVRSDFFPGLGWMMTRKLWTGELQEKWPKAYWDDWLREPAQRKDRHILRPEVSRTFHFGTKGGASLNQFGKLNSNIWLNPTPVDWEKEETDLTYLLPDRFDRIYWNLLHSATRVSSVEEAQHVAGNSRLEYKSLKHYQKLAKPLALFTDEKAGIPRTAYKGIIETRLENNHFLFLTPPMDELQKEFESSI